MVKKIGYARVSTDDQSLDLQLDKLNEFGCDEVFTDKGISGKRAKRPGLDAMLNELSEGDMVVVFKLDRLGRSMKNTVDLLEELKARSVNIFSITEGIDTSTDLGRTFYYLAGIFAQMESANTSERVKAGMKTAKAKGQVMGAPQKMDAQAIKKARGMREAGISISAIARDLKLSRGTLYRHVFSEEAA